MQANKDGSSLGVGGATLVSQDPQGDRPRAKFHSMDEGTQEDWAIIAGEMLNFYPGLPDRVLGHLKLLDGDFGGFAVDRLTHSLQTATRAYRANRDDEYVLCALLHDIGDNLASFNHADLAAAIVKPFVAEPYHWMVDKHGIFQGYYFFHFIGADKDMRDKFAGHEHFDLTEEFCADYDQVSFDPAYDTLPLEHFEPLVRELMARPKRTIYSQEKA